MNICFLASAASVHSHRWISFFVNRGHTVTWISTEASSTPVHPDIRYHEIRRSGPRPLALLATAPKVRRIIQTGKFDLVHAHYVTSYGFLGLVAGRRPFLLTAWGSDVLRSATSAVRRLVVRRVLNSADAITCDAEHMREAIVAFGTEPSRIRVIYFGTDTKEYHPRKRSDSLRLELGLDDSPAVISVRSLAPIYNIETLIRAVPLVLKQLPHTRFLVGGRGPEESDLKNLAQTLGVSRQVQFLGAIPSARMAEYLASADAYVSTSLQDAGLSASTAEAMASGLPVVLTDSGENRLWVDDGENGYVVPVRDPAAIAERLISLLLSPETRAALGRQARATIEERNSYSGEMAKIEDLYLELARGAPALDEHSRETS